VINIPGLRTGQVLKLSGGGGHVLKLWRGIRLGKEFQQRSVLSEPKNTPGSPYIKVVRIRRMLVRGGDVEYRRKHTFCGSSIRSAATNPGSEGGSGGAKKVGGRHVRGDGAGETLRYNHSGKWGDQKLLKKRAGFRDAF